MNTVIVVLFVLGTVAMFAYGYKKRNLAKTVYVAGSEFVDLLLLRGNKKDDMKEMLSKVEKRTM